MIDRIYFLGSEYKNENEIIELSDKSVLYSPRGNESICLDGNSVSIGANVLNLFHNYDIVYLDIRLLNTTDLGMGFLSEFDFKFFNAKGDILTPSGYNVYYIESLTSPELDKFNGKKLRFILNRPENSKYRFCKTGSTPLAVLQFEFMKRSIINLVTRMDRLGFDTKSDLLANDGGGFSTVVCALLRDENIRYYSILEDISYDNGLIKKICIEEVF